jgi:hypothetical protein
VPTLTGISPVLLSGDIAFECEVYGDPPDFEFGVQDPDGHDIAFGQPL